jgi:glutamine amidotransferase
LIKGKIKRFDNIDNGLKVKVPHVCWNKINKVNSFSTTPIKDVDDGEFMYFVHSFYVHPSNDNDVLTKTSYGGKDFCSSVQKNNIFATQFHPEKSAEKGLLIYKKWSQINNLL